MARAAEEVDAHDARGQEVIGRVARVGRPRDHDGGRADGQRQVPGTAVGGQDQRGGGAVRQELGQLRGRLAALAPASLATAGVLLLGLQHAVDRPHTPRDYKQLAAAIESINGLLYGGDWPVVGETNEDAALALMRRETLERRRDLLRERLDDVEAELAELDEVPTAQAEQPESAEEPEPATP